MNQLTETNEGRIDAFTEVPAPPCEWCENVTYCKNLELACGMFKHYVAGPDSKVKPDDRNRFATRETFEEIFRTVDS